MQTGGWMDRHEGNSSFLWWGKHVRLWDCQAAFVCVLCKDFTNWYFIDIHLRTSVHTCCNSVIFLQLSVVNKGRLSKNSESCSESQTWGRMSTECDETNIGIWHYHNLNCTFVYIVPYGNTPPLFYVQQQRKSICAGCWTTKSWPCPS